MSSDKRINNGGAREGAGRKKTDNPKLSRNWAYDPDMLDKVDRLAKKNRVSKVRVVEFAVEELNANKKISKK